jgi:hypothetical protein
MLGVRGDTALWVGLCILATWRVSAMLCFEDGPLNLLRWVRRAVYSMHLGSLVECFHCVGVWVSALLTLAVFPLSRASILFALAVSGGASLLEHAIASRRETGQEE